MAGPRETKGSVVVHYQVSCLASLVSQFASTRRTVVSRQDQREPSQGRPPMYCKRAGVNKKSSLESTRSGDVPGIGGAFSIWRVRAYRRKVGGGHSFYVVKRVAPRRGDPTNSLGRVLRKS